MFLLKLATSDLERLVKISAEKRIDLERLARLAFLKGLRLLVKTGSETKTTADTACLPKKPSLCQQRREQLGAFIHEYWETKSDAEIGRLMSPPVSRGTVVIRRLELGLKRHIGRGLGNPIREAIEPGEFERMVMNEGYTMTEYIRFKKLSCTRERLRQVAEELGLKHSPEDRTPEWGLVRQARKLGNLNLANREWLAERIASVASITQLAADLSIADRDIFLFIRAFDLTHPSFRKHGRETVDLVCTKCGKEFTRLKRWVDRRYKKADGKELDFFCSQSCTGQYNSERVHEKTAKKVEREHIRAKETEDRVNFIRENWEVMSDAKLALKLNLSESRVTAIRLKAGIERR